MHVGFRQFQNSDIEWFKSAVSNSDYGRYDLDKELCARVEWRNGVGELCFADAYQVLKLTERLGVELPTLRGAAKGPRDGPLCRCRGSSG